MSQPNPPARPGAPGAAQLPVELPDDVAEGTYTNLMFITHSPSEFVLDFARALPGGRKGKIYSRVVMTPQHAKALAELLKRNLGLFEEKHGAIKLPGKDDDPTRIGFAPVSASPGGAQVPGAPPAPETPAP